MQMEEMVRPADDQLRELAAAYPGWRFGLGGSGHWWAIRRNECVRALTRAELEAKLREHLTGQRES